ncbi:MAG: 3-hydroxyacyl-ACP dehydratase FabZ, partial [FCB group bacterium]|nr:3-hydroxyacyl-ACP dehydratase FabZ [FCB group bacterium]
SSSNGQKVLLGSAFDVNTIMKLIPHRFPFLLVDRIISFVPNERVIGIKNVTANEPFFQGHWPNLPVMPAVLIMEVMAQVSSPLLFDGNPDSRRFPFFLGIEKARFRRTVTPGDQIVVEAELVHVRRNAIKVRAVAKIDGNVAAEAEMLFGVMEVPDTDEQTSLPERVSL